MQNVFFGTEWEPSDPILRAKLIEHILGKMTEWQVPFLFCRFSREAYTVDLCQRDRLKQEVENRLFQYEGAAVTYAGTSDVMATVRLSQKQFEKDATLFLNYFSERMLVLPREGIAWENFRDIFCHGFPPGQLKQAKSMAQELLLIATDEGRVQELRSTQ